MSNCATAGQPAPDAPSAPAFSFQWSVPSVMATLGPTMEKPEDLEQAVLAGVGWFRLPCGYRQRPHVENARTARAAAQAAGQSVHLLLDLPSSRPRTGTMPELNVKPGDPIVFWDAESSADAPTLSGHTLVPLPGLLELLPQISPGHRMWFCDGRLNFVVDRVTEGLVFTHLQAGTIPLKSSNSLFLPDSASGFTAITPPDRALLEAFAAAGVVPDWVALSLIAGPEDVIESRATLQEVFGCKVQVMAKFETVAAVERAAAIIAVADGAMVARGDLGLAVGYANLPAVQDELVAAVRAAGKPVVVATQIMESFAATGIPQRAELSDLSLIARQRADVIMLGKETVFSPRPLECIRLAREVLTRETRRFEQASHGTQRPL